MLYEVITIWVESRESEGSTFSFTIDAVPVSAGAGAEAERFSGVEGRRVLVVDDNQTNRRILNLQCVGWGMECLVVPSGKEVV